MGFSKSNILCVYVLAAFTIGDCSLSPIIRPFLSLLDSTSSKNGSPSRSSYRVHGPLPPVSVSSDRWGGAKMEPPVIIPKVTTLDGGASSKTPVAKVITTRLMNPRMDEWTIKKPEYLNRMGDIDGGKLGWAGNAVPKISVNPLKKGDWVKKPVIVKPLKGESRRLMVIQKNDADGDSGEAGGLMRSHELGSNEQAWRTSRWITPTPMDSGEPEHDSDDQADRNKHGVKTYWRPANIPVDSKEHMERIVIIEKPMSSWSHTSRKHILRRAHKMARNGQAACPYCNEANWG